MHNIFLERHTVIAANGAGRGFATCGGTSDGAHGFYSTDTFEGYSHNGGDHHAVFDALEEFFASEMSIVFREHLVSELHHFETTHAQAFFLKTREDFTHKCTLYGAGFEEN